MGSEAKSQVRIDLFSEFGPTSTNKLERSICPKIMYPIWLERYGSLFSDAKSGLSFRVSWKKL